ncbi:unnamed protein product [Closterium sp. NIES-64]|nr:unnamed protein product [Closterium sp. NIES-64]
MFLKRKSAARSATAAEPVSEPTTEPVSSASNQEKAKTGASDKDRAKGFRAAVFPVAVIETDEEENEPSDDGTALRNVTKLESVFAKQPSTAPVATPVAAPFAAPVAAPFAAPVAAPVAAEAQPTKLTPAACAKLPPPAPSPGKQPVSQPVDIKQPPTAVRNRNTGLQQNRPIFQRPVLDTIPSAQELESGELPFSLSLTNNPGAGVTSPPTVTTPGGSSFSSFILSLVTPRGSQRPASSATASSQSAASSVYSLSDSDVDSDSDEESEEEETVEGAGGEEDGGWSKLASVGKSVSFEGRKTAVQSGGAGFWNRKRWLSFSPRSASAARACARAVAAVDGGNGDGDGCDGRGAKCVKSTPSSSYTSPSKRLVTSPDAASESGSVNSAPAGGSGGGSDAGLGGTFGGGLRAGGRIKSGARMGMLSRSMSERLPPLTPLATVLDCDMPLTWTASLDPDLWAVPEHGPHGGGGTAGECSSCDRWRGEKTWPQEKDKDDKLAARRPRRIELPARNATGPASAPVAGDAAVASPPAVTPPAVTPRLPELTEESFLLSEATRAAVFKHLPATVSSRKWVLLYSTVKHGISLLTLYRRASMLPGPCLLVVSDSAGTIFGAFSSPSALTPSDRRKYQGSNHCFVFSDISGSPTVHAATGRNHYYVLPTHDCLAFGGGGRFALRLEEDLLSGSSGECDTFASPCLAGKEDFCVKHVEKAAVRLLQDAAALLVYQEVFKGAAAVSLFLHLSSPPPSTPLHPPQRGESSSAATERRSRTAGVPGGLQRRGSSPTSLLLPPTLSRPPSVEKAAARLLRDAAALLVYQEVLKGAAALSLFPLLSAPPPSTPISVEKAAARLLRDAAALLVYQEVFKGAAPQAFLRLLLQLRRSDGGWGEGEGSAGSGGRGGFLGVVGLRGPVAISAAPQAFLRPLQQLRCGGGGGVQYPLQVLESNGQFYRLMALGRAVPSLFPPRPFPLPHVSLPPHFPPFPPSPPFPPLPPFSPPPPSSPLFPPAQADPLRVLESYGEFHRLMAFEEHSR